MKKKIYEVIYFVSKDESKNLNCNNLNTIVFSYMGEQSYRDIENKIVQTYRYRHNDEANTIMRLIENILIPLHPINNYSMATFDQSIEHITPVYDQDQFDFYENIEFLDVSAYKCRSNAVAFNEAIEGCRTIMYKDYAGNYKHRILPTVDDFPLKEIKNPQSIISAKYYRDKLFDESGVLRSSKFFNGEKNRANMLLLFGNFVQKLIADDANYVEPLYYDNFVIPSLKLTNPEK